MTTIIVSPPGKVESAEIDLEHSFNRKLSSSGQGFTSQEKPFLEKGSLEFDQWC